MEIKTANVSEVITKVLLFLLIFGMSATVELSHLREQLHNKFAILSGISMQFIIMPFLGYISVLWLNSDDRLSAATGMTLLIVTSSPGGSFSNWWCSIFNADLALSVAMTALSTILSSFLLPANLLLYSHAAYGRADQTILKNVNWIDLFVTLAVVILAIFCGLMASAKFRKPTFRRWANRLGSLSGIALIVFSAALSSFTSHHPDPDATNTTTTTPVANTRLWNQPYTFYLSVAMPCLAGLLIANLLTSLTTHISKPERVTISIECCYQNVGIATSAAVSMFRNHPAQRNQAICVPLFYGFLEAVILTFYCLAAWKHGWTKAPKQETLWKTIVNTYEVDEEEGENENEGERNEDEEQNKQENKNEKEDKQEFKLDETRKTEEDSTSESTDPWEENSNSNNNILQAPPLPPPPASPPSPPSPPSPQPSSSSPTSPPPSPFLSSLRRYLPFFFQHHPPSSSHSHDNPNNDEIAITDTTTPSFQFNHDENHHFKKKRGMSDDNVTTVTETSAPTTISSSDVEMGREVEVEEGGGSNSCCSSYNNHLHERGREVVGEMDDHDEMMQMSRY